MAGWLASWLAGVTNSPLCNTPLHGRLRATCLPLPALFSEVVAAAAAAAAASAAAAAAVAGAVAAAIAGQKSNQRPEMASWKFGVATQSPTWLPSPQKALTQKRRPRDDRLGIPRGSLGNPLGIPLGILVVPWNPVGIP